MSMLLNPPIAHCNQCEWEIVCGSHEEKVRKEKIHADRAHLASVEAVTALLADDPSHDADAQAVADAIELDAHANGGEVDPNRVRGLIASWVQPQVVGAVYAGLVRQGRLTQVGWTTNTDRRGRNCGKPIPVYEWREPS